VLVRDWGEDEAVAYAGSSARTHIVSEAAAHILKLSIGPGCEEASLGRSFWGDGVGDSAPTDPEIAMLRETVEGLVAVGLLKRRP
jgi:hypothetical protein